MSNNYKIPHAVQVLFLLSSGIFLFHCGGKEQVGEETRKPNIVYILADDLGYGDLGCYGQEKIETPHIDALAEGGLRFTQHYSGAPVCAPARCVLMTGLHTGHAYIRGNHEWGERGDVWSYEKMIEDPELEGQWPIPDSTVTVAELLKTAGYTTACVGKWGLGAPLSEGDPTNQGFDFFYGYNCQRQAHTYYPMHLWKNTERDWLGNRMVAPHQKLDEGVDPYDMDNYQDFTLNVYSPQRMLEETLTFVEDHRDRPFFLYFASPIPHLPLQAPKRWVHYYVDKFGDEVPYTGDRGYFPNRYPHATYAAMVSYLDEQVGAIMEKLKEMDLLEHTLIIFSSDNGPTYTGGADSEFFDSGRPFRSDEGRGKGNVYEGGIRVPMIVAWEGTIQGGTVTPHISAFWDVLPTLCEVSGVPVPEQTDGISMWPVFLGADDQEEHDFLYWEFPSYGGQQAVRMGQWKGIRRGILEGNLYIELYNLQEDLVESVDLHALYPERVAAMDSLMRRAHVPSPVQRFQFEALGD